MGRAGLGRRTAVRAVASFALLLFGGCSDDTLLNLERKLPEGDPFMERRQPVDLTIPPMQGDPEQVDVDDP